MKNKPPTIDTNLLLRGVNDKDSSAWNALFNYYYPQLCAYAERLMNDTAEAEDCIQEVFLYMWTSKNHFQTIEDLTYFLYRVTHNQALMRLRNQKRREHHHQYILDNSEHVADDMFASIIRQEMIRQVHEHIHELPAEQAKVVSLCIDGLSNQEIADQLGISINTVKTHKSRSFKFLRGKMEEWDAVLYIFLKKNASK